MQWLKNGWQELAVVLIPAAIGLAALALYRRSHRTNLLAAVIGFTCLAAAVLGGALWAAGVPQAVFGNLDPTTQTNSTTTPADAVWKVTQSITLTFGALGVVAASVIAYHRQRSQAEQVVTAQDQLDLDRRTRQHERYAKGSEMIADESPAVRIAGLNVIAALGREVPANDELRQTCINLICAYLRIASPVPPAAQTREEESDDPAPIDKYRAVTAEACRTLPSLLELRLGPPDTSDTALTLDLRNTILIDLNLQGRQIGKGSQLDGAVLREANLRRTALRGANLTRANLSYAALHGADLSDAALTGTDLHAADLDEANLTRANLYGADLRSADLSSADLSGADLQGINLSRASLRGANLLGANLTCRSVAHPVPHADLRGADLTEANLSGANLQKIVYDSSTRWPAGFTPPNPPLERW